MATLPNYTNCPSCGRTIPLAIPTKELFQACICGEWLHYEPEFPPQKTDQSKEPTKVVENIQPVRPPRTTRMEPPENIPKGVTTLYPEKSEPLPRQTEFLDREPPVQPKTNLQIEEPSPTPEPMQAPRQTGFADREPPVQPPTKLGKEEPPQEEALSLQPVSAPEISISKRKSPKKVLAISLLIFSIAVLLLIALLLVFSLNKDKEEKTLREQAAGEFHNRNYLLAAEKYGSLRQEFPTSQWEKEYRYWEELSRIKHGAETAGGDFHQAAKALANLNFGDTSLEKSCSTEAASFARELVEKGPKAEDFLDLIEETLKNLEGLPGAVKGDLNRIRASMAQIHNQLASDKKALEEKNLFLKKLREFDSLAPARVYLARKNWVDLAKQSHPEWANLPETKRLLQLAIRLHLRSIVYEPAEGTSTISTAAHQAKGLSLYFQSPEKRQPDWLPQNSFPLPANIRGTLFAFNPSSGKVMWGKRLGHQVINPPKIFPSPEMGSSDGPALILTLCENGTALCALDSSGQTVWQTPLGGNCLAGFMIWGHIALVPCAEGHLLEVELAQGKILGKWLLGQHLLGIGTLGEKDILLQPADPGTVLLLDLKSKKCQSLVYTNHAHGSLLGQPLLASLLPGINKQSHFFLPSRDAQEDILFSLFPIPTTAVPEEIAPLARWTFPGPLIGKIIVFGNRVAFLGQQGILNFLAWKKASKWEESLVPILGTRDRLELNPFFGEPLFLSQRGSVEELGYQDMCITYRGRLGQLRMLAGADGVHLAPGQANLVEMGAPVFGSLRFADPKLRQDGLLLAGKLPSGGIRVAAFDLELNRDLWHHRLNGVFRSPPVKAPSLQSYLATDEAGAVFMLPHAPISDGNLLWASGGKMVAPPVGFPLQSPPLLFPMEDQTVLQFLHLENTGEIILRRLRTKGGEVEVEIEVSAGLDYQLAAPPAVLGEDILLARTQGNIVRIGIHEGRAQIRQGPPWQNTPDNGPLSLTILGPDSFAFCNKEGGIEIYRWPQGKQELFQMAPLPYKGLLRSSRFDKLQTAGGPRFLLWSKEGVVTGLKPNPAGEWENLFQIPLGTPLESLKVTILPSGIGPARLAVVGNEKELFWIDPMDGKLLWKKTLEEELAHAPVLAGKVWTLFYNHKPRCFDDATGKELPFSGDFPPHVYPSASPWVLDKQLAFPLEDGTVFFPFLGNEKPSP